MNIPKLNRNINNKIKTKVTTRGNTTSISNIYLRKKPSIVRNSYENGVLIKTNKNETYKTYFEIQDNPDKGNDNWWYEQEIIDDECNYYFDVFQWGDKYVIQDADLIKFQVEHITGNQWKLIGELP